MVLRIVWADYESKEKVLRKPPILSALVHIIWKKDRHFVIHYEERSPRKFDTKSTFWTEVAADGNNA